jgi:hypothetical protein
LDSKVLLELESVEGGRHDDDFEVGAFFGEGFEETHEDISGKCTFVSFIEDDGGVAIEVGVVHGFPEKHTVRHIFEESDVPGSVMSSKRIE